MPIEVLAQKASPELMEALKLIGRLTGEPSSDASDTDVALERAREQVSHATLYQLWLVIDAADTPVAAKFAALIAFAERYNDKDVNDHRTYAFQREFSVLSRHLAPQIEVRV